MRHGRVEFTTITPTADVNAVTGWALERGIELTGLVVARPTLEDVFLELAGSERAGGGGAVSRAGNGFPATPALVLRQVRYQQLSFRRTPIAVFFTLALPLIMLVLFNALFGDEEVDTEGGTWPLNQFYTGSLAAFTAVSATFTNLANLIPIRREEGVLKRWRGTPLPPWVYIAGAIGSRGRHRRGRRADHAHGRGRRLRPRRRCGEDARRRRHVHRRRRRVRRAGVGGRLAGAEPGRGTRRSPTRSSCRLAFVSDVFIQIDDPPAWVDFVGDLFPLKAFVQAFQAAFNPNVEAPGFEWGKLAFVAAWGVLGLVVALRWFKWEPVDPSTHQASPRAGDGGVTCIPS